MVEFENYPLPAVESPSDPSLEAWTILVLDVGSATASFVEPAQGTWGRDEALAALGRIRDRQPGWVDADLGSAVVVSPSETEVVIVDEGAVYRCVVARVD